MSDSTTDGTIFTGTVEDINLGESITIDGETHHLADAANLEPEVEVGGYVEAIRDGAGMVTSVSTAAPPPPAPPPAPPTREPEPAPESDSREIYQMTLIEHLEEMRDRLIKSVIALGVATGFSLIFARQVLKAFESLLPGDAPSLQTHTPTEAYVVYFKVALLCGMAFAMPIIVYQLFAFVMPGLTRGERRWLYFVAPGSGLLFVLGLLFAYFVVLPFGLPILQSFLSDLVLQQWRLDYYVSFVVRFLLITGLIFETPLVIFFLSKLGVVSHQRLTQSRRYAVVVAAAVAAVLTPTTDPFTMLLVMGPMILLYEFGVLLARFA
ncbi:MAG: Sec-independent protein translocase protein TatC [Anaerolineales bacterium]|nr:Sec-independent protein translocase protein TatC [Anaerolineales bacterium]